MVANGRGWKFERDIEELIQGLSEIGSRPTVVLLTWHSQGVDPQDVEDLVQRKFRLSAHGQRQSGRLDLVTSDGRKLNCGRFFRWHALEAG